ncbi:hypothetical protein PMALA_052480 [Plasmodium malariae]|uniref:Uncharacterized protein n=1 Tax=Plasmodium malariae TaxID=5858 RepID=A0A1A8WY29_PLAMA|nr:hypothetical protein PMALA_052480 [Plasmodium malariae]
MKTENAKNSEFTGRITIKKKNEVESIKHASQSGLTPNEKEEKIRDDPLDQKAHLCGGQKLHVVYRSTDNAGNTDTHKFEVDNEGEHRGSEQKVKDNALQSDAGDSNIAGIITVQENPLNQLQIAETDTTSSEVLQLEKEKNKRNSPGAKAKPEIDTSNPEIEKKKKEEQKEEEKEVKEEYKEKEKEKEEEEKDDNEAGATARSVNEKLPEQGSPTTLPSGTTKQKISESKGKPASISDVKIHVEPYSQREDLPTKNPSSEDNGQEKGEEKEEVIKDEEMQKPVKEIMQEGEEE